MGDDGTGSGGGPHRWRRRIGPGLALLLVLAGVGWLGWLGWRAVEPGRSIGPDPTVGARDCGRDGHTAVVALDTTDGSLRWSARTGAATALTVDGGTVRVRSAGGVASVRARDGALLSCGAPTSSPTTDDPDAAAPVAATGTAPSPEQRVETLGRIGDLTIQRQQVAYERGHAIGLSATTSGGDRVWEQEVPGYWAAIAAGRIVVLDQSNGTRTDIQSGHATLDAYDPATGTRVWSSRIANAWQLFVAEDLVIVNGTATPGATGSGVALVDAGTGRLRWDRDHGNPARTRRYSETEGIVDVALDPDSKTLLVLLAAAEPYRD